MYQALYRKWRPRTFDEVVGQTHITETLKRQVETGRLSHAYLFTGTRGTGKTTCAKILARAVNCEHPVHGNPCNVCPACLGIENGSILDVLELDAASNNGVDQVRALREEAIYTPAAVKKRVYIVDEVHMLSTPAFNALLKILEEPPAHLMFILATTELHKVPATIKSRCQQFAFKRILPSAIGERLRDVARQEGIALTKGASGLLARLADGGLRDALSLLDQCSGAQGEVKEAVVLQVLGLAGNRASARMMDAIAREDTAEALEQLNALYQDGKDMGALLGELSSLARDLLICKTAPRGGVGLLTGGYEEAVLQKLLEQLTAAELVQMLTILQNTQANLYRSSSRRLDVELCLIRLCDRSLSDTAEGLSARVSRLEAQLQQGGRVQASVAGDAHRQVGQASMAEALQEEAPGETMPAMEGKDDRPPWQEDAAPEAPEETRKESPSAPPQMPAPEGAGSLDNWEDFLSGLRGKLSPAAYSFLTKPELVTGVFGEQTLTIWVDSELTRGVVGKGDSLRILEEAARAYTGRKLRAECKLGKPQPISRTAPKQDKLNDLLALGRKFENITVKE